MTTDPAQQLANIGRRVLHVARPLVTLPEPGRLPDAYENLLLDPIGVLSNTCNELLEWSGTAAAQPESSPSEAGSSLVFDLDTPAPFSRAAAPTLRTPRDGHEPRAGSWREIPPAVRLGTLVSGTTEPPSLEQVRRATEASLVPLLDEPRRDFSLPEAPSGPVPKSEDNVRSSGPSRHSTRRGPNPHESPGEISREGDGTAREAGVVFSTPPSPRAASRGPGSNGVPGNPSGATPPGDHGPAQVLPRRESAENEWLASRHTDTREAAGRGTLEARAAAADPRDGVRLTANPSRFAALLREHVSSPGTGIPVRTTQDDAAAFPDQPEDDGCSTDVVDGSVPRPDDRSDVEEIIERLADELETEFVRTYGSSGS